MTVGDLIKQLQTFPPDTELQAGNNAMRTGDNQTKHNLDMGYLIGYEPIKDPQNTLTLWFDE